MTGERRAYLDRSPGETRAVVTLDGRPERLLIAWEDDRTPRLGARYAARVEAVSERLGLARLDLGDAPGTLRIKSAAPPVGERLEVEITAEAVRGKPATVRRIGPTGERPGALGPPLDPQAQLAALGLDDWIDGERAREVADAAEAEALSPTCLLPGGLDLMIEPTRALTAIDLDFAETGSSLSAARANLRGVAESARLLRLKAIGGLVAIDLIGFPKEAKPIQLAAMEAFAPDGPSVSVAPVSRFGVLEIAKPRAHQPLHERLLDARGEPSARACAHALVRALERQGRFEPGSRLEAVCVGEIAEAARPWVAQLGPRFGVSASPGALRGGYDIRVL